MSDKKTLPTLPSGADLKAVAAERDLPMPGLEPNPAVALVQQETEKAIAKYADAEELLGRPYNFDEQTALIKADWQEAQAHAEASMYKVLTVGKRLAVIQEMEGPHWKEKIAVAGTFSGMNERQIYKSIQMFREFGAAPAMPKLLEVGSSKLLECIRLPEDLKDEIKETGMLGGDEISKLSLRELRKKVKELRAEKEELEGKVDELKEENEQGQEQLAQLEQELAEAKSAKRVITADAAETREDVQRMRQKFGEIAFDLTTMVFDGLDDETIIFVVSLIDEIRAQLTLIEQNIDSKCGIYDRLKRPVTDGELFASTEAIKDAQAVLGKPHKPKK